MAPGASEVAFFIGSREGNSFAGDLPETGDYTIRGYLFRNAARRGEVANYSLEVAIGGRRRTVGSSPAGLGRAIGRFRGRRIESDPHR
jgi:hypothetical protein